MTASVPAGPATISSDKAVNRTNVMGATRRAAEMVINALAAEHPATRLMACAL